MGVGSGSGGGEWSKKSGARNGENGHDGAPGRGACFMLIKQGFPSR